MKDSDWHRSPIKIEFGEGMVLADVAVDRDHTLSLFTEKWVIDNYNINVTITPKEVWHAAL